LPTRAEESLLLWLISKPMNVPFELKNDERSVVPFIPAKGEDVELKKGRRVPFEKRREPFVKRVELARE
jgi:hypothetical protein